MAALPPSAHRLGWVEELMPGRKPKPYLCPRCLNPANRVGNSIYFECDCGGRLVLKGGELRETRSWQPRQAVEKEAVGSRCSADEYEKLAS